MTGRMKTTFFALLILMSLAFTKANADPFRHPLRRFGNVAVDLSPLFKYWQLTPSTPKEAPGLIYDKKAGSTTPSPDANVETNRPPRPLAAWKLVRGKVVEIRPFAMIVDAEVSTIPGQSITKRIYLYNAPLNERAEFDQLTQEAAQLAGARAKSSSVFATNSESAKEHRDMAKTVGYMQAHSSLFMAFQLSGAHDAASISAQAAQARSDNALKQMNSIDGRLREINQALSKYPAGNEYMVECFAIDTGKEATALPLFDCGVSY